MLLLSVYEPRPWIDILAGRGASLGSAGLFVAVGNQLSDLQVSESSLTRI